MNLRSRSKAKDSSKASTSNPLQTPHQTAQLPYTIFALPALAPIPTPSPTQIHTPPTFIRIPIPTRNMANQPPFVANNEDKTVGDYAVPTLLGFRSPIRIPDIQANHWEVKPALINMVSNNAFTSNQNPSAHLASFLELCATFKLPNVPKEVVYLKLFPFSLMGKAKE